MGRPAVFIGLLLFLSAPVAAQDLAQPSSECELHFWASDEARTSNYSGAGGVLGGALSGPSPQSEPGLSGDLSGVAQAEALERLDLASLFKVPEMRLVRETGTVPVGIKVVGPRLTNSSAQCYNELIVDFIGYSSHITAGRKFGARFWLRQYSGSNALATVRNGGADVRVRLYPPKQGEDRDAALSELRTAFGQVAAKFLTDKIR